MADRKMLATELRSALKRHATWLEDRVATAEIRAKFHEEREGRFFNAGVAAGYEAALSDLYFKTGGEFGQRAE